MTQPVESKGVGLPRLCTPVVLFAYRRPDHTRKTLEALSRNPEAQSTELYVFCDGPRPGAADGERVAISEVRKIVRMRAWCGSVHVVEAPNNIGLADSVISGVSRVLERHERVIVLEDDIETAPGFLTFMNQALEFYAGDERVKHVSAYLPKTSYAALLPDTFFDPLMLCWGWGTWRRAWKELRLDGRELLSELCGAPGGIRGFDLGGVFPLSEQLADNIDGRKRTWAVYWAATVYLSGGLCLIPGRSLVRNNGIDGTGENFVEPQLQYDVQLADHVPIRPQSVRPSRIGRFYLRSFFRYGRNSNLASRVRIKLQPKLGRLRVWALSAVRRIRVRLLQSSE